MHFKATRLIDVVRYLLIGKYMITTATFPHHKIVLGMMNQTLDIPSCFHSSLFSGSFSFVHIQRPEEITIEWIVETEEEETEYIRHDMVEALCICLNSKEEYLRTQYWLQNVPAWTFSPMFPIFLVGAPKSNARLDSVLFEHSNPIIPIATGCDPLTVHSLICNAVEKFRVSRMCGTSYSSHAVMQPKN